MSSLKEMLNEIQQVDSKIRNLDFSIQLKLNNPIEVQKQIDKILQIKIELKDIKKQLSAKRSDIEKQLAWQAFWNPTGKNFEEGFAEALVASFFGKDAKEIERRQRNEAAQTRATIKRKYSDLPIWIDKILLKADKSIDLAREYIQDPIGVKARIAKENRDNLLFLLTIFSIVLIVMNFANIKHYLSGEIQRLLVHESSVSQDKLK